METGRAATGVGDGYQALANGDWRGALAAFDAALDAGGDIDPDALDGRGRALWWLRDAEGAVASRERAYAGFRREGDLARAARLALWLAREYSTVWGNEAAAGGWMARAERLLRDTAPAVGQAWLALARSERTRDAEESAALATTALEGALAVGDVDLEIRALAQLGLANVSAGHLDDGLAHLDEAMAAASAGESTPLETFADVCCTLMLACDLAGDDSRPRQWSQVVDAFLRRYEHVPLLAFCRTCCADVYVGTGRIDEAEQELVAAIRELTEAGQRSRCAHPASKLAAIRVMQGRLEEADELLRGLEGAPEAVEASAALRLARGDPAAAAALLERRLDELGWANLVGVPLLALLVQARLTLDDQAGAKTAADAIAAIAVGRGRSEAIGRLARGRVAAASGDSGAEALLADAAEQFARVNLPLDAARARLELARALGGTERELAVDGARRAHRELEDLGADREAAAAASLLRTFGAKTRSGPRALELLTKREEEVLRLLGEGLSNAEDREPPVHQPQDRRAPRGPHPEEARPAIARGSRRLFRTDTRGQLGVSPLPRQAGDRHRASVSSERSNDMTEQNKARVREYYERVINGRDLDAVDQFFADERIVEGVRRGCFSYFNAFPDLHCSLDEPIAEGDKVFLRSTMTGTHDGEYKGLDPTGRHISTDAAEVFRIADGKFVGYWCLTNVAGLMRQLTEEPAVAGAS